MSSRGHGPNPRLTRKQPVLSRFGIAPAGVLAVALAGVLITAPVVGTSLANADALWSAPASLSTPGADADAPQVVVSADGNRLTAVWARNTEAEGVVQTTSSSDGGANWRSPVDLSAPGQFVGDPQEVASDDGRKLTVVWPSSDGRMQSASSSDAGVTWGTPVTIAAGGEGDVQVAASADGNRVTAVWQYSRGSTWGVRTASSDDAGATWGARVDLVAPGQYAASPQVIASANGTRLTAVWQERRDATWTVQATTSNDAGVTWSTPATLSTPGADTTGPHVAGSADGSKQAVVWYRSRGSVHVVQAVTSSDGGATWGAPVGLSTQGGEPQVAAAGDGRTLVAVWVQGTRQSSTVQASTSNGSGTWSRAVKVSGAVDYPQAPRVTLSGDGSRLTSVWTVRTSDDVGIVQTASSSSAGATWSAPTDLTSRTQAIGDPYLAASDDGRVLAAVWNRPQNDRRIVTVSVGSSTGSISPLRRPAKATGLRVERKKTRAIIRWREAPRAASYQVRLGKKVTTLSGSKLILRKLKPRKSYTVTLRAINAAGKSSPTTLKIKKFHKPPAKR